VTRRFPRWFVLAGTLMLASLIAAPAPAQQADKSSEANAAEKSDTPAKADKTEKPEAKKATVAEITLRGSYPEGPTSASLFSELQPSLSKVVERIEKAADDKSLSAVILRIDELALGRAKVYELRAAIDRVRKAGKPVYALLDSAEGSSYLLAAACDEIVLAPPGMLLLPGVRAEVTFYKGLFDKLGIEFEMLQMGKYKGAAEPFTRREMSPALRENMESLVDGLYDDFVSTIAKDRKLDEKQVALRIDEGIFTAEAAQKAKLVDRLAYRDDLVEAIRRRLKVDKVDVVTKYGKKETTTDFSGLAGFMKLMEMAMGGKSSEKDTKQRKIAVVYAVGAIMPGKSTSDLFGEQSVGSTTMVEALRTAADDSKVVAIVLRVDSPGGSAVASDLIWHEVVEINKRKPVIASMGDVAASGGYYISMGARQIVASPNTVTGSIGVVGGKPVLAGLMDKVGVNTEVISRGKNSGLFSISKPFSEDERSAVRKLMEDIYGQFVSKAAEGRKMPKDKLESLAQGRVYTGQQAKAKGLVDQVGTLEDAIAAAKKAAGVAAEEKLDIQMLPKPKTIFEQLFEDPSAAGGVEGVLPEIAKSLSQTAVLRRLFAEPVLTLLPFGIEIK